MNAIALDMAVPKLPVVTVATFTFPDAVPMLNALIPLAIVDLSIGPSVNTLALRFISPVLANVPGAVSEYLEAPSIPLI